MDPPLAKALATEAAAALTRIGYESYLVDLARLAQDDETWVGQAAISLLVAAGPKAARRLRRLAAAGEGWAQTVLVKIVPGLNTVLTSGEVVDVCSRQLHLDLLPAR